MRGKILHCNAAWYKELCLKEAGHETDFKKIDKKGQLCV